jgi:hypothetical protein
VSLPTRLQGEVSMMDAVFIAVLLVYFTACVGFVIVCERL